MKIVCTVSQDTAMLTSPRVASMVCSTPCASWARTSTMPTAARLATAAHSVSTSLVALLGSSLVARLAVDCADMGQIPNQTVAVNMRAMASQPMAGA